MLPKCLSIKQRKQVDETHLLNHILLKFFFAFLKLQCANWTPLYSFTQKISDFDIICVLTCTSVPPPRAMCRTSKEQSKRRGECLKKLEEMPPLKNIFFDVLPINLWANQVASSSSSSSPASSSSSSSSSTSKNIKQIKNIKHLLSPKASRSSPIRNFTPKRYTHHTSTHNLGTRSLGKRSQTTLNRISKSGLRLWKTKFCQPWSLGLTTRWKV